MSGKHVTSMGGARDFEKLAAVYEQLDKSKIAERTASPQLRQTTGDPDQDAKLLVQDLMQFFMLLCMEFSASPQTMIYAVELFSLNVINAQDCPLSKAKRDEVRQRAFEYYRDSLPKIPSGKPAPRR